MDFRFPTCKIGVWIFVFLLVRPVCGFSLSHLQGQCVHFRLRTSKVGVYFRFPTCKADVWIFVFLLARSVCGFSCSYL